MSLFGVIMYGVSLGIGFVYIKFGLIPAMGFHAAYDLTAFVSIRNLVSDL